MSVNLSVQARAKLLRELEEMVQCSVCLEPPQGHVRICRRGHHFCQTCHQRLQKCPLCRSTFLVDARNICVEQLAAKLDEIRALLAPAPQIDPPASTVKCCIGVCRSRVPEDKILEHVEAKHPSRLLMLLRMPCPESGVLFSWIDIFSFEYGPSRNYQYALKSTRDDLFFVRVIIDETGLLRLEIEVAHISGPYDSFVHDVRIDYLGTQAKARGSTSVNKRIRGHKWPLELFQKYFEQASSEQRQTSNVRCHISIQPKF